MGSTMGLD